ncbi:hypothetical protein K502DRAFT_350805 [Neoconidiobolus thromboides FSU 785]|nr:hypothetical protein K502DRAFT_350805 [Neoconidiobolus thromboides FSU 785]
MLNNNKIIGSISVSIVYTKDLLTESSLFGQGYVYTVLDIENQKLKSKIKKNQAMILNWDTKFQIPIYTLDTIMKFKVYEYKLLACDKLIGSTESIPISLIQLMTQFEQLYELSTETGFKGCGNILLKFHFNLSRNKSNSFTFGERKVNLINKMKSSLFMKHIDESEYLLSEKQTNFYLSNNNQKTKSLLHLPYLS